jgi:hypothetical protein
MYSVGGKSNSSACSEYCVNLQAYTFCLYQVALRLIGILKLICAFVQFYDIFVYPVCFKLINFVIHIFPLPPFLVMEVLLTSCVTLSILLTWVFQALQFSLLPFFFDSFEYCLSNHRYAVLTHVFLSLVYVHIITH